MCELLLPAYDFSASKTENKSYTEKKVWAL